MDGKESNLIGLPFEYDGTKEKFVQEKIKGFEERFKNFLGEMETDVARRLRGFQRTRERLAAKLEVLEGIEAILKKEKEAIIALVGFSIDDKEEIITNITSKDKGISLCTDESIMSHL